MPDETKLTTRDKSLLVKREDAAIAYYRAKLVLAEANAAVIKAGIQEGRLSPGQLAGEYW